MRVAISGTPGCGKSRLSKILAKKLDFNLLELNKAIKKYKLYSGYDKKRKTYIADMRKVSNFVRKETKQGNWLIDSHLSHYLSPKIIDKVIVLRCNPGVLERRLKKKHWNKSKIQDNVEAEMIGLISYEAKELHKKVLETNSKKIKDIIRFLK